MDAVGAIVDRIEHIAAHILARLEVKAQAISWCNSGEEIDPDRFSRWPGATTDARITASIFRYCWLVRHERLQGGRGGRDHRLSAGTESGLTAEA